MIGLGMLLVARSGWDVNVQISTAIKAIWDKSSYIREENLQYLLPKHWIGMLHFLQSRRESTREGEYIWLA